MCRRDPSKSKVGYPFELLRDMMRTPCVPDYLYKCALPPKVFERYPSDKRSAKHKWIPYEEIKRMLLEDKVKREQKGKKTHGNN
jgi:hypothetical protein